MVGTLVEARDITKKFGQTTALGKVSFDIVEGEAVALVGPNGAGKSTLMSIICGFLSPTAGRLKVAGHQPGSRASFGVVGALPQDALFNPNESVGEQLKFFAESQGFESRAASEEARRVLGMVRLSEQFDAKPGTLSHGMGKRIAIAQALIGKPRLIVLDEPTAGLDPETARHIRRVLSDLIGEVTLLISSHNLDELEDLCTRTLFLEKGTMREVGHDAAAETNYLTIEMDGTDLDEVIELVNDLKGVSSVLPKGKQGALIQYDPKVGSDLDLELLMLCKERNWVYRSILKGRSLEDQLFSNK